MERTIQSMRAWFLVINLIIAVVSFGYMVEAQVPGGAEELPEGLNSPIHLERGELVSSSSIGPLPVVVRPNDLSNPSGTSGIPFDVSPVDTRASGAAGAGAVGAGAGAVGSGAGGAVGAGAVDATTKAAGFSDKFFNAGLLTHLAAGIGLGVTIGGLTGGKDGALWGAVAGGVGTLAYHLATALEIGKLGSLGIGLGAGGIILLLAYKKESEETVTFSCTPFEPPIGGDDCELCNDYSECSEYICKSLGQACALVNVDEDGNELCVWQNPLDVNSPKITFEKVTGEHIFKPDVSVRPPATGVVISRENQDCIKAFTPLEFTIITDEPAQCKIDYNLTREFDAMSFFVGGSTLFLENHSEALSLPGPENIAQEAPEIQNDGSYTLFVRCQDANGNFNQDPFSVSFCVEKGPDTTPPRIEAVSIPSGSPIQFNQTSVAIEIYLNEPSECKWDRSDTDFDTMQQEMQCDVSISQINANNLYACRTTLTGVEDRKENEYYFRCKDQPFALPADRNVNTQSSFYTVLGTQPLTIQNIKPLSEDVIRGATDTIPVFLEITTDNGHNGEALCSYTTNEFANDEDYIEFLETRSRNHRQRQDLVSGEYTYYLKCIDLGGNVVLNKTTFRVEVDRQAPLVVRAYRESGSLKIITNEAAECTYSFDGCNFVIEDGVKFSSILSSDLKQHTAQWSTANPYYIKCEDQYDNQPSPNTCSIILRPSNVLTSNVVSL